MNQIVSFKRPVICLLGLCCCTSVAGETKKTSQVEALPESFLLFLAELEQVDGQWVHPVDLQQKTKTNAKPTTSVSNKPITQDGKQDDNK